MSRYVIPNTPGLASGAGDGFGARLTKYLPAELVTLYTASLGLVIAARPPVTIAPWIAVGLIALFLAATLLYFVRRAPAGRVRTAHLIASPIAFVAWAYPLAAPLLGAWFIGWVAALGQAVAALAAFLIQP